MVNNIGELQGENPAHRVAVSLEQMPPVPPVNPTLANQFAKLLEDERSPHHGSEHQEESQLQKEVNDLKQRGFRFVEKMLLTHVVAAPKDDQQHRQADGGIRGASERGELTFGNEKWKIDLPLRSGGTQSFQDSLICDLGNELAECIRHVDMANSPWHAEIGLSSNGLPATRLLIDAEEAWLRLHFVSANADVCNLLRGQRYLLLEKVSRVSSRPVIINIAPISGAAEHDEEGDSV